MKWIWSGLFGGGEVDIPDEPIWRSVATIPKREECTVTTRMVTTEKESKVELIMSYDGSDVTVTLKTVKAIDGLIGKFDNHARLAGKEF